MLDQWCMVVIRNLPCRQIRDGIESPDTVIVEDIVAVFGPYSKEEANQRTYRFNEDNNEPFDMPGYEPVLNAPDFINQKNWDEHFATARPMNHIPW